MDNEMSLLQEIRLTVNKIVPGRNNALNQLTLYVTQHGSDAYIYEMKCLIEDLTNKAKDAPAVSKTKAILLESLLHDLFRGYPQNKVMVSTAFDMAEIDPRSSKPIQSILQCLSLNYDMAVWLCICLYVCNKPIIRNEAVALLMKWYPLIVANQIKISLVLYNEVVSIGKYLQSTAGISNTKSTYSPTASSPIVQLENSVSGKIASILIGCGSGISQREDALRYVYQLDSEGMKGLQLVDVLYIFVSIGNSIDNEKAILISDEYQTIVDDVKAKYSIQEGSTWDTVTMMSIWKEVLPGLDYSNMIECLDTPSIHVSSTASFQFISSLYQSYNGKVIPYDFVLSIWKNPNNQAEFLNHAMSVDSSVYSFMSTPHQVGPLDFISGNTDSCWKSLDLLQVLLSLPIKMQDAQRIFANHTIKMIDSTMLFVALVQLSYTWNPLRYAVMCMLINKMITSNMQSSSQRNDIERVFNGCMQLFYSRYQSECLECIISNYGSSSIKNIYLTTLYRTCMNIPGLLDSLFSILTKSVSQLDFAIHLVFIDATTNKSVEIMRDMLDQIVVRVGITAIQTLLTILEQYFVNNNNTIITDMGLAQEVLAYTRDIIVQYPNRVPDALIQICDNLCRYSQNSIDSNHLMVEAQKVLEKLLFVSTYQEQMKCFKEFKYLLVDGNETLVTAVLSLAIKQLDHLNTLQSPLLVRLINLFVWCIQNSVLYKSLMDNLTAYMKDVYSVATIDDEISILFCNRLVDDLMSVYMRDPKYLMVLSKAPLFYQYYPQASKVAAELKSLSSYPELVPSMSPVADAYVAPGPSFVLPDAALSPATQEKLQQNRIKRRENIRKPIVPIPVSEPPVEPEDRIQSRISMIINNLTESNISNKGEELMNILSPEMENWFADFLVKTRVERQPNYHDLYAKVMEKACSMKREGLYEKVLSASILLTKSIITLPLSTLSEQHILLKNMGSWLGKITIGGDRYLSQLRLNLQYELYVAFYHQRLLYVYSFVCEVLRACKTSSVIKPPSQPWLMSLLSLLKEIKGIPGIKPKLTYPLDNLMTYLDFSVDSIPSIPSDLYLAIPPVENNPDFEEKSSQDLVMRYFYSRYPQLASLSQEGESSLRYVIEQGKQIPEFVPKSAKSGAISPQPVRKEASEAPQRSTICVLPESVKSLFSVTDQGYLSSSIDAVMGKYYNTALTNQTYLIAVSSSTYEMYERDLAQVADMKEVFLLLRRATEKLVNDMISVASRSFSRDFCSSLLQDAVISKALLSEEQLLDIVKANIDFILNRLKSEYTDAVMNEIKGIIMKERMADKELKGPNSADLKTFAEENNTRRNEIVKNNVLNDIQRSVYVEFGKDKCNSEAIKEEDVSNVSSSYKYGILRNTLGRLIRSELNTPYITDTRLLRDEMNRRKVRDDFDYMEATLQSLKGKHTAEEDRMIVSLIADSIRETRRNNFRFVRVISELSGMLQSCDMKSITPGITETVISLLADDNVDVISSFITNFAFHRVLDIAQCDTLLSSILRDKSSIKLIRFAISCLNNLVLVNEYLTCENIPKTMNTLKLYSDNEKGSYPICCNEEAYTLHSLYVCLMMKKDSIMNRIAMDKELNSDSMTTLVNIMKDVIGKCTAGSILNDKSEVNRVVAVIDQLIDTSTIENATGIVLRCLLSISCYQYETLLRNHTKADAVASVYLSVITELVQREEEENRSLVLKAIMQSIIYLLIMYHNNKTIMCSFFYIVLTGIIREILFIQPSSIHDSLLLDYCGYLLQICPSVSPIFTFSWIELITYPQFMSMLLSDRKSELEYKYCELVIQLLTFYFDVNRFGDKSCINELYLSMNTTLFHLHTCFPGFLAKHMSQLIVYIFDVNEWRGWLITDVSDDIQQLLIRSKSSNEAGSLLLKTPIESRVAYMDVLTRYNCVELLNNVMAGKNVDDNINGLAYIAHRYSINLELTLLQNMVMYCLLEEDRIRSNGVSNALLLLRVLPASTKLGLIQSLLCGLRHACKETKMLISLFTEIWKMEDIKRDVYATIREFAAAYNTWGVNALIQDIAKSNTV